MNAKEALGQWLRQNGFDGLCGDCGLDDGVGSCMLGDLGKCDNVIPIDCLPAYKVKPVNYVCADCDEYEYCLSPDERATCIFDDEKELTDDEQGEP